MIRTIAAVWCVVLLGGGAACGDAITLKTSAVLPAEVEAVTLASIAELSGEAAQQFAGLVIATRADDARQLTIDVQQVRAALDKAGAHWGLIDLSGWKTEVRIATRLAEPPLAMTGASIGAGDGASVRGEDDSDAVLAGNVLQRRTAASALAAVLSRELGLSPESLRLTFDAADHEVLALPLDIYRIERQLQSTAEADHVTMQIRAWQGDRIAHQKSVRIGVEALVDVAVAARDLRRGDVLVADDARSARQWIGGSLLREMISADALGGRIVTASKKAGEMIRHRDVKQKTLIERGDIVQVRCLVGGVVLTMQAEARADGSDNELIEFRKLGERATFLARVTGRGEAIVDLARR